MSLSRRSSRRRASAAALAAALTVSACALASGGAASARVSPRDGAVGAYGGAGAARAAAPAYLFELGAPAEAVWDELAAVYAELGLPVSFVDAGGRRLGNDRWSAPALMAGEPLSRWLDCGRGIAATPTADAYDVVVSVRSTVSRTGSGSVVATTIVGSGSPRDASGGVVACSSRGTLERRMGERLEERLARKRP